MESVVWIEAGPCLDPIRNDKRFKPMIKSAKARLAASRGVAAPDEVAAMVVFLLTDACQSATGATFDINGASYVR